LRIWWPKTISNKELWETTKQIPISSEIKMRQWKWIGHTLRKDQNNITRQGLDWNPEGERRKGRPSYLEENSVSRTTRVKVSWKETKQMAKIKQSPLAKICDGPMFHLETTGNDDCIEKSTVQVYVSASLCIPVNENMKQTSE
jgi:hypothetical protein